MLPQANPLFDWKEWYKTSLCYAHRLFFDDVSAWAQGLFNIILVIMTALVFGRDWFVGAVL
jgi:hypothetical protein